MGRLIDLDDIRVMKFASEDEDPSETEFERNYRNGWNDALIAIDEIQPIVKPRKGKWIPVSEMLPEDDVEVIVSCTDDSGDTSFSYTTVAWHFKGTWICDNERCFFITAWMPLPEPYRADMRGEQDG